MSGVEDVDSYDWTNSTDTIASANEALQWLQEETLMFPRMEEEKYMAMGAHHVFSDDELMNMILNPNNNLVQTQDPTLQTQGNNTSNINYYDNTNIQYQTELHQYQQQISSPSTPITTPTTPLTPMTSQVSTPVSSGYSPSQKILQEILQVVKQVAEKLEGIKWQHSQIPTPLPSNNSSSSSALYSTLEALDRNEREVKNAIEWADKQLNQLLLDAVILESNELDQLLQLQHELFIQQKQLEVYLQELQGFTKEVSVPSLALVITAQPFPDSVKQHKPLEETLTVRLLTGAKFNYNSITHSHNKCIIKAEVINTSSSAKSKRSHSSRDSSNSNNNNIITVENAEKPINESGVALFNDIKFPNGTRLKSIRLKFTTRMNVVDSVGNLQSVYLETGPTNAIVVKTNENQWFEAEGILLKKTAYAGQTEITWQRLANWLQRRYLLATRQNAQSPIRPLSAYDFQYIHKLKFDNKPIITQKEFDKFWVEWFGPILHKIRYQRHISSLWTRGYICGFLTREEVDAVLQNEQVGTFLIRFSERCDQFAVSYQSSDATTGQTKVKHYLIKADDIHGAKKTLPDFLRDYKDFSCLLQLWTEKSGIERRVLRRCEKDTVLREFYSKRGSSQFNGYDDTINVH